MRAGSACGSHGLDRKCDHANDCGGLVWYSQRIASQYAVLCATSAAALACPPTILQQELATLPSAKPLSIAPFALPCPQDSGAPATTLKLPPLERTGRMHARTHPLPHQFSRRWRSDCMCSRLDGEVWSEHGRGARTCQCSTLTVARVASVSLHEIVQLR